MCHITHLTCLCRTPNPTNKPHPVYQSDQISRCGNSPSPRTPCPRQTHTKSTWYRDGLCDDCNGVLRRQASIMAEKERGRADAARRAQQARVDAGLARQNDVERRRRMVQQGGGVRGDAPAGRKQKGWERKQRDRERARGRALQTLEGQRGRNAKRERAVGVEQRGVEQRKKGSRACVVM